MNIEIANRLHDHRKQHGLSQEELADRIGVSRQTVSKWERAAASPDTDNLLALAQLYGVTLDQLMFGQDVPVKKLRKRRRPMTKRMKITLASVLASVLLLLVVGFSVPVIVPLSVTHVEFEIHPPVDEGWHCPHSDYVDIVDGIRQMVALWQDDSVYTFRTIARATNNPAALASDNPADYRMVGIRFRARYFSLRRPITIDGSLGLGIPEDDVFVSASRVFPEWDYTRLLLPGDRSFMITLVLHTGGMTDEEMIDYIRALYIWPSFSRTFIDVRRRTVTEGLSVLLDLENAGLFGMPQTEPYLPEHNNP